MRHCEAQTFDAKRLPAVNNVEQWFIAPASVDKGIADIKLCRNYEPDVTRHVRTCPDMRGSKNLDSMGK